MTQQQRRIGELANRDALWLCLAVLDIFAHAVDGFTAPGQVGLDVHLIVDRLRFLQQAHMRLARLAVALMKHPQDSATMDALKAEVAPYVSDRPLAGADEGAADDLAQVSDARLVTIFLGLAGAATNMLAIVEDFAAWRYRGGARDVRQDLPGFVADTERTMLLLRAACEAGLARAEANGVADAHLN